ncbi:MAG: hypothetical protein HQK60_11105 [Deltaproteobacteria bacterium]|nr:hypothetical protein [Deltaproteobacteria bacterium]
MIKFIFWYLVVQLISWLTRPLSRHVFVNLPDRGYAFNKSLSVLLTGLILWFGTCYGLLKNTGWGAWLAVLVLGVICVMIGGPVWPWSIFKRRPGDLEMRPSPALVLVYEGVFLGAFALWALVRAYDPGVGHTEQPMDLMFMNGIWTSPDYPPHDPWLNGYAISYYYLGYWLLTTLGRLVGLVPEMAYNVGQACWFGLLCLGTFGIGYNLLATAETPRGRSPRKLWPARVIPIAVGAGLLSTTCVVLMGNLSGVWDWLQQKNTAGYWWWPSSRVISDSDALGRHLEVIDEFPIFSYILGDTHPHLLAMPFVLLIVALALNLFLYTGAPETATLTSANEENRFWSFLATNWRRHKLAIPANLSGWWLIVICVGALIPLNTWDFPAYWLLLAVSFGLVLKQILPFVQEKTRDGVLASTAFFAALVILVALVLYLPYLITSQSQFQGLLPNLFNPTSIKQLLLYLGPLFVGPTVLICRAWAETKPAWKRLGLTTLVVVGVPMLFILGHAVWFLNTALGRSRLAAIWPSQDFTGVPAMILERWGHQPYTLVVTSVLLAAVITLLWPKQWDVGSRSGDPEGEGGKTSGTRLDPARDFALMLAGLGLLMIYLPEFVYIHDQFSNRMNTIFKFYYQAWLLLGLATAFVMVTEWHRGRGILLNWVNSVLIGLCLIYSVAATHNVTAGFSSTALTLNAIKHQERWNPDEMAAVRWVLQNTTPRAVIAQMQGASYTFDSDLISVYTGRPTLLGWDGHEVQWRGKDYGWMAGGRPEALAALYNPASVATIIDILKKWSIDYVYIGPGERRKYQITPVQESMFERAMDPVFKSGSVRLFMRRVSH